MIKELIYTSAVKGLKPGTGGYCTVAHTRGMSKSMIRVLESLSSYNYPTQNQTSQMSHKPAAISHCRAEGQLGFASILSRVGVSGGEHTNRDNILAHHLVIDSNDRPGCDPARLAAEPIFYTTWDQPPVLLEPRPADTLPDPRSQPANLYACNWEKITGDPGWAGFLTHHFNSYPGRPVSVIYEPGMEVLPLLTESLALIPPEKQWLVTFSTYFTNLPAGISCLWRCRPPGSRQINTATPFLDLSKSLGEPPACREVEAARRGLTPPSATPPRQQRKISRESRGGDTVRVEKQPEKPKLRLQRKPVKDETS